MGGLQVTEKLGTAVRKRDLNTQVARIADLIAGSGPDVDEIARSTGLYRETVRYRYRKMILDRGLMVQAIPAYEKLGLSRVLAVVRLNAKFDAYSDFVLTELNGMCYLTEYWQVVPSGEYLLQFTVPNVLLKEVCDLLQELRAIGFFTHLELFDFRSVRNPPMMTRFFDFHSSTWCYDWSTELPEGIGIPRYGSGAGIAATHDYLDLLILKQLSVDANRSQVAISDETGIKTKTLGWHYCEHVLKHDLIKYHRIRWMGAHPEPTGQGVSIPRYRYIPVFVLVADASEAEMLGISTKLNGVPFLWEEGFGAGNYCASLFVPTSYYVDSLSYLLGFMKDVGDRGRTFTLEQGKSMSLSISTRLFDREKKRWKLERDAVLAKLENLFLKVRPHKHDSDSLGVPAVAGHS